MSGALIDEEPDLKIAGLSIWVDGWERPKSLDYWDGNWLIVRVHVDAPGALVSLRGPWLRTDEVVRFADQLAVVCETLKGTAELRCLEPALSATLTCSSLGQVEVVVNATPDHLTQTHRFLFGSDQSFIPAVLSDCRRLIARYPVRGQVNEPDPGHV